MKIIINSLKVGIIATVFFCCGSGNESKGIKKTVKEITIKKQAVELKSHLDNNGSLFTDGVIISSDKNDKEFSKEEVWEIYNIAWDDSTDIKTIIKPITPEPTLSDFYNYLNNLGTFSINSNSFVSIYDNINNNYCIIPPLGVLITNIIGLPQMAQCGLLCQDRSSGNEPIKIEGIRPEQVKELKKYLNNNNGHLYTDGVIISSDKNDKGFNKEVVCKINKIEDNDYESHASIDTKKNTCRRRRRNHTLSTIPSPRYRYGWHTYISSLVPIDIYPNIRTNISPNIIPNIIPNISPNIIPNIIPNISPNIIPNLPLYLYKRLRKEELFFDIYGEAPEIAALVKGIKGSSSDSDKNIFSFGHKYCYNSPKFKNLKDEVLNNKLAHITKIRWKKLLRDLKNFIIPQNSKVYGTKKMFFGLLCSICGDETLKYLISIKLYTDFDDLQREYKLMYWKEDEDKKDRLESFYHWDNTMKEFFKELYLPENEDIRKKIQIKPKFLYTGISELMPFEKSSGIYYGPLSTTYCPIVARSFGGKRGMVLQLSHLQNAQIFNVSFISAFPDEVECIVFNSSIIIRKIISTEIFSNDLFDGVKEKVEEELRLSTSSF